MDEKISDSYCQHLIVFSDCFQFTLVTLFYMSFDHYIQFMLQ